jgi:TRAP-type C4-dicarboxylate transport system substrate-binding protein
VHTLEDLKGLRLRAPQELTGLLADIGADPVNMAMQDVYSALAKGVIDGVVAPADTLQSLHFNEVAKHFTTARFARGAYPSRAISLKTWEKLSPDMQALLERSIPVWEKAMETEITKAQEAGFAFGRKNGIDFVDFSPESQTQLDELYNKEALISARNVKRGKTTAEPIFTLAQQTIQNLRLGAPNPCPTGGAR